MPQKFDVLIPWDLLGCLESYFIINTNTVFASKFQITVGTVQESQMDNFWTWLIKN